MLKVIVALLLPSLAFAHGGGLDSNGGHREKVSGTYHCHTKTCLSVHGAKITTTENKSGGRKYNRKHWAHWSDFDNDCMNTRHEILKAQAAGRVTLSNDGCWIKSGVWHDPFSGTTLTKASDLDVDHIIPLKWAHDHGGADWSARKKELFANDPVNLLAVDDGLNQAKGARGPDEWLPPNQAFRCDYLTIWRDVLSKYPTLGMTAAENRIYQRQLNACGR